MIELLLARNDDLRRGDAAAFILDRVHFAADGIHLFPEFGKLGLTRLALVSFHGFNLFLHRLRHRAGFEIELLLGIRALAVFVIDGGGHLDAAQHLLRLEGIHAIGHLLGLKHALIHLLAGCGIDHVGIRIDQRDKGVPHLLSRHAAQQRPGEVIYHARCDVFAGDLTLVGAGIEEHAHEGLHVVLHINHQLLQILLHLGIRRHGGVHQLVQRLNQGQSEGPLPKAVDDHGGEARIILARHPACIGLQRCLARLGDALVSHHRARLHCGLGFRVSILVVMRQGWFALAQAHRGVAHGVGNVLDRLAEVALLVAQFLAELFTLFLHFFGLGTVLFLKLGIFVFGHAFDELRTLRLFDGIADGFFLFLKQLAHLPHRASVVVLCLDAIREGRHFVELHLRPFVEGVIVALGALDPGTEKHADRAGHVIQRHAAIAHVIANGSVVPGLSLRGDHLADKLVVRFVIAQALLDEIRVGRPSDLAGLIAIRLRTQHIRPVVEEVLHVAFRSQQLVDQFRPLVAGFGGDELLGLARCRDSADGVEVDAPDKSVVIRGRVSLQVVFLPVSLKDGVDLA